MNKVYLDNAATTQIREEVIREMVEVMSNDFGNPSSTHSFGRNAKNIIELSRKAIAKELNCNAQEIIFTSGGTESNNIILRSCVRDLQVKRIITSKIEHHAVLHTIEALQKEFGIQVDYVAVKKDGSIDVNNLVELLSQNIKTLVSLMHVNNEVGAVLDIDLVARICQQNQALFHSDTVQSVAKTELDLQNTPVDFIVAAAHKFHGPKGIGFAFIRKNSGLQPLIYGGEQEKGLRAGTEAVHQIAGLAKAFEISYEQLNEETNYISELKSYCSTKLQDNFNGIIINGENSFYTILNILLPFSEEKTALILFNLDI